ncbi:aminoglycoside phosphotransferase [Phlyctema vagabunda]|uniref:Aminoglycoside phosphotransferase n=1 Tax=Phlyctema vagabunda TaxID=108571 RepID=A0ABR4P737_9HELO
MGTIRLGDALDDDDNVLPQLRYPGQKKEFWDYLMAHNAEIATLFNVCIPVLIPATGRRGHEKVFTRFPLPYKIGEAQNPGNVEEKLRTEIAAYIWLQEQCPDVPIPTLYGFGLPGGQCDCKILHQPNAVLDQDDGEMQLAALTALRATMHRFTRPEYRDGPFFFTLTDLHRSNIFVNDQWNIQTIIDLEWACSQPVEMQLPPYWLTSKAVDGFKDPESVADLDKLLREYFEIYAVEEKTRNGALYQAPIMRHVWEIESFWYFQAVKVPKGMYRIINSNIQPLFNKEHCEASIFDQVFWWYWGVTAQEVIKKKIKDKEDYTVHLKQAFGANTQ